MQDTPAAEVESVARTRPRRRWRRLLIVFAVMALLLGVPWWTLLSGHASWLAARPAAALTPLSVSHKLSEATFHPIASGCFSPRRPTSSA